jgi:hypothetical protein
MIKMLENKVEVINLDESNFNFSDHRNYGWKKPTDQRRSTFQQKMKNITLLSAVTSQGDHYYTLIRDSHNRFTFKIFLE